MAFDPTEAAAILRRIAKSHARIDKLNADLAAEHAALAQARNEMFRLIRPVDAAPAPTRGIAAHVLAYLRGQPEGAKAAQVQRHLAEEHNFRGHPKTPGMTLFRLMKRGLVRRQRRTWFYVGDAHEPPAQPEERSMSGLSAVLWT